MSTTNKIEVYSSSVDDSSTLQGVSFHASDPATLNIGIIGAGGFAEFAANAFLQIAGVHIIGVADINADASSGLAKKISASSYDSFELLLMDKGIDLVYIATPPFLHFRQSKMALMAGKHVICEKPAALKAVEAEELCALASSRGLLYVVNLMQRYNPLYKVVDTIIKEKLLGNFLHGFFENYASDEKLDPGHWFWDKEKSGGIFIEHGVHFFDMFSGWLGKGKVINAIQQDRQQPGKTITDRVEATVLYEHGTVHFYHGFNQLRILDRQEMRLQFEYGDITLYEWVPVKMKLTGLLRDSQIAHLQSITGECTITYDAALDGDNTVIGRSAVIDFDHKITVECGDAKYKQERYAQLLTSMLNDQWSWIKDRAHKRTINERNAVDSLVIAEKASLIAQNF